MLQVRAGELAWAGQDEALSTWLDKKCPSVYDFSDSISQIAVKTSSNRHGIGYDAKKLEKVKDRAAFFSTWKVSMETYVMADEAANRAVESVEKLRGVTESFRLNVKNDIASMKAASERVQTSVVQMSEKYKQAMGLLNSPEFQTAVANAERMAKALESISSLSETKLSVAVFSGGSKGVI